MTRQKYRRACITFEENESQALGYDVGVKPTSEEEELSHKDAEEVLRNLY